MCLTLSNRGLNSEKTRGMKWDDMPEMMAHNKASSRNEFPKP